MNLTYYFTWSIPHPFNYTHKLIYESKGFNIPYFFFNKATSIRCRSGNIGLHVLNSHIKLLRSTSHIWSHISAHDPKTCNPMLAWNHHHTVKSFNAALFTEHTVSGDITSYPPQKQASLFSISEKIYVRYSKSYKIVHKQKCECVI